MKRNHPPDDPRDSYEDDQIIDKRIKELFEQPSNVRRVNHRSRGDWCQDKKQVVLADNVNVQQYDGMISGLDERLAYMNSYQALFSLESAQLLIFHNELPLSFAEAYRILLHQPDDVANYLVFAHLNRKGFFCLPNSSQVNSDRESADYVEQDIDHTDKTKPDAGHGPILDLNSIMITPREARDRLRLIGPKLDRNHALAHKADSIDIIRISFDAYKRETFSKNKPSKSNSTGKPDYHVVVCDKAKHKTSPTSVDLQGLQCNLKACCKCQLLIALVDSDGTLSFVQFSDKALSGDDFFNLHEKILPYKYHEGIAEDYIDPM